MTPGPPAGREVPAGIVLHALELDPEHPLILDLATGLAEPDTDLCESDPALVRLAYLSWCWELCPVPTPTAFWQLESALLCANIEQANGLRRTIRAGLNSALLDLQNARTRFPARVRQLISEINGELDQAVGAEASTFLPNADLLRELVAGLRAAVRQRRRQRTRIGFVVDVDPPGSFEPEWDRSCRMLIDTREHSVRVHTGESSWTVSVASLPRSWHHDARPAPFWARIVDIDHLRVIAECELSLVEELFVGRGLLPAGFSGQRWRADLVSNREDPPRRPVDLSLVYAKQSVYRALALTRIAGIDHPEWCQTQNRRTVEKLYTYLETAHIEPVMGTAAVLGGALNDDPQPFLGEETLDPTVFVHLASPLHEMEPPI